MVAQQRFDFAMGVIADGMDLRREVSSRKRGILIEQGLDSIMVLLEQRSNLFLPAGSDFEVSGQMIELLVNRRFTFILLLFSG